MRKDKLPLLTIFFLTLAMYGQTGTNVSNYTSSQTMSQSLLDNNSVMNFNQTTAGVTITLPNPTNTTASKNMMLRNFGNVPITIMPGNLRIPAKSGTQVYQVFLYWHGTGYALGVENIYSAGDGLSKVGNEPSASFKIDANEVMMKDSADVTVGEIWAGINLKANSADVYTKTQSDSRYLQSFTESDPVYTSGITNYYTKSQADAKYLQDFTESDPVYISGITNYYNKSQSDSRYLQTFTEVDGSITNEIQSLSLVSNNLSISGGNSVDISGITSGKQNQLNGTGFVKASGTTITYDNSTYLTSEVDGSTTNEIELPSQTGQSGKILTTNGSVPSWTTASAGTVTSTGITSSNLTVTGSPITSSGNISVSLPNTGVSAGMYNSAYAVDATGRVTSASNKTVNDNPGRTLATTTSSTGFQISATRNAVVCYEGTFQTTSTIGGPSSITIYLETANTNSTTPSDWTVIAQQVNSNTITLAVVLQQVDIEPWSISRTIPAGKYVRIRYGNVTGTATATISSQQQEVID
jgi:hypothetical protein